MQTVYRILTYVLLVFMLAACGEEKKKRRSSSNDESLRKELESSKQQQEQLAKELELLRKEREELRKERERREAEERRRLAAERARVMAEQNEKLAKEKRMHMAQTYADKFGKEIMKAAGGGRDLVVSVKKYTYNSFAKKMYIDLVVSFNGSIIRANNYLLAGRMTINEDGSQAKFARTYTNQNFKDMEARITMFRVLEAVAEENKKSKQRQKR